jgi:hypothetical protein
MMDEVPHDRLVPELEAALERLEAAEVELAPMYEALERAHVQVRALGRRVRILERRLASANQRLAAAQEALRAERAWTSEQARAVAASQSWRLGHRLVRTARALTLRSDRGLDGLTVIVRRMEGDGGDAGGG